MSRRLSIVLAASLSLPGCLTYSAVQHLRDGDKPVPHVASVLIGANVIGGAVIGGLVAADAAPGDRAITFAQGMAAWNVLDLAVGLPLFAMGLFRDEIDR